MQWMKGVANVRGRLMTVMDLSRFLGQPSELQEKRRRLLVLDQDDLYTGVIVDEVLGMQHFPSTRTGRCHRSGKSTWGLTCAAATRGTGNSGPCSA